MFIKLPKFLLDKFEKNTRKYLEFFSIRLSFGMDCHLYALYLINTLIITVQFAEQTFNQ